MAMKWAAAETSKTDTSWGWPLLMTFIRLPLALTGSGIAILAYQISGHPAGIAAGLGWSTLTLTIINFLCLGLLIWRGRVEGFDLKGLIGFRRDSLFRDLLLGLVWSLLLGGLLLTGIFAVVLIMYSPSGLANMGAVFVGDAAGSGASAFSFTLPAWLAWVSAVAFPLLNPLVEELQYRGYAQPRLMTAFRSAWRGILSAAAGFGLQHLVFAVTFASALAYVVGFFLWGLGAGWIAYRQMRLVQLIVAHFISNLSFGIIPLLFVVGGR